MARRETRNISSGRHLGGAHGPNPRPIGTPAARLKAEVFLVKAKAAQVAQLPERRFRLAWTKQGAAKCRRCRTERPGQAAPFPGLFFLFPSSGPGQRCAATLPVKPEGLPRHGELALAHDLDATKASMPTWVARSRGRPSNTSAPVPAHPRWSPRRSWIPAGARASPRLRPFAAAWEREMERAAYKAVFAAKATHGAAGMGHGVWVKVCVWRCVCGGVCDQITPWEWDRTTGLHAPGRKRGAAPVCGVCGVATHQAGKPRLLEEEEGKERHSRLPHTQGEGGRCWPGKARRRNYFPLPSK